MLIIPNMKMPKRCDECPCEYDGHCNAVQESPLYGKIIDYSIARETRQPWCPLIEKKPGIRILTEK